MQALKAFSRLAGHAQPQLAVLASVACCGTAPEAHALLSGSRPAGWLQHMHLPAHGSQKRATDAAADAASWQQYLEKGVDINPCGSPHHPAVVEGLVQASGPVKSLQESYTPTSSCFGCGPQSHGGLHLQSYRDEDGVVAEMELSDEFCCFPGVISGGIISTLLDCHGNWAAAVRLMDESCLPGPPLTVTYSMSVTYRDATPPNTPLLIRALANNVQRSARSNRVSVNVDMSICEKRGSGQEAVLVTAAGVFKRLGALRAI